MNELDYVKTKPPYEGAIVFSPSKFSMFVDKPHQWYREQILGEPGFAGNTMSVTGTIVHYIVEKVIKDEPVDKEEIERYIDSKEASEDYDPDTVRKCYPEMAEALVNGYVLEAKSRMFESEVSLLTEIEKGFFTGGTMDLLEGTKGDVTLSDYKTYNSTRKPTSIPSYYKYQLLVYAIICKKNGYNVTRIRLVYVNKPVVGAISEKTGKQLKSYPSEVTVLTEALTQSDLEFIDSLLHLAVDSCKASEKYPELRHVIWHDPRLKQ